MKALFHIHNFLGVVLDRLEAFGLTSYEARALDHLIRHGQGTGPDVAREAEIPLGRVYDCLNGLVERGLATSKGGRPRVFASVPPASISGRLMAHSKRQLEQQQRELEQTAQALQAQVEEVSFHPSEPRGHGIRLGEDAAREFLVEATHAARSDVLAYLAFQAIDDADLQIFDAFRGAVTRGVHTRVLLREGDVDYLMGTPYVAAVLDAMLPHLGDSLQVRLTSDESIPYSVLDRERVVIGVQNPLDPTRYFGVVHADDTTFAGALAQRFEALWQEADLDQGLLQRVLKRLEREGDTRTARFLETIVRRRVQKAAKKARRSDK